jgi:signal transduction histidine kinase
LLRLLTGLRLPLLAARGEGRSGSGHEPARELEQARALVEQANSTKQLFLGNMSHELRTPLHAVLSYAQLGRDATSANEQREYFERITERGQALLDLLSNLLDLTRLESGSMRMEFAPHDLTTLVRDVLRQMEPEFRAKQLRSEYKRTPDCESGRAIVDPVRVGQLFQNVFANAIRVSPVGSLITVQLSRTTLPRSARQAGAAGCAAIEIAISDEGVGIPESELELIFDKFIESSKTRSNAGGIGVGLAICREIVALHDGAIWASNNRAAGATVRVALPLTRGVVEGGTAIRTEHAEERGAA